MISQGDDSKVSILGYCSRGEECRVVVGGGGKWWVVGGGGGIHGLKSGGDGVP